MTRNLELDAEKFSFDRVADLFVEPPEGRPLVSRNALVVGQRGVGKTTLLKQIYVDYRDSPPIVPIYVELEPWTSRLAAESGMGRGPVVTPDDIELAAGAQMAISAALMAEVEKSVGAPYLDSAIGVFPSTIREQFRARSWKDVLQNCILDVCSGRHLPCSPDQIPLIFEVANALGADLRGHGRTLLVLVDQCDKVPRIVAGEIAKLLDKGGTYVAAIATRPYPTAPDAWSIPASIVAGDDYAVFTLGRYPRESGWKGFLLDALIKQGFPENVNDEIANRMDNLVCLAGGSVRSAALIAQRLERDMERMPPQLAWETATQATADDELALARNWIAAYCGSPPAFLSGLRELSLAAMQESGPSPSPVTLRIATLEDEKRGLFGLTPRAESLIRVSSKAGIFWPTDHEPWAPDRILDEYDVSPLLLLAGSGLLVRDFLNKAAVVDVLPSQLDRWARPIATALRRPDRKGRVFVSHRMTQDTEEMPLPAIVGKGLAGEVEVLVGGVSGSSPWVKDLIDKIHHSDIVVVDVSVPRRDIYVELGVAIGFEKPTLLLARSAVHRTSLPSWLQERQILIYPANRLDAVSINAIRRLLSGAAAPEERWQLDGSGDPLPRTADPGVFGFIVPFSREADLRLAYTAIRELALETLRVDLEDQSNNAILYDCIRTARRSGTIVTFFAGSESDYLCCIAAGIFAAKPSMRQASRLFRRRILGVSTADEGAFPGIVRKLQNAKCITASQLTENVKERISDFVTWRSALEEDA